MPQCLIERSSIEIFCFAIKQRHCYILLLEEIILYAGSSNSQALRRYVITSLNEE